MKCKRRGCKKKALPGKDYCGTKCSRADNIKKFIEYTGIVPKIKRVKTMIKKETPQQIQTGNKQYCAHYDPAYYTCVNCISQAVFKCKPCYKEVKK